MKYYNRIVDKKALKKLSAWVFTNYGSAIAAQVADELKELGFHYATKAGVSISIDDLQVPTAKRGMIESAETEIRRTEKRYVKGEITEVERFQKVIDTWNSTSEALKEEVVRNFQETNPLNSVYMMAFSGARGNLSQVRQLVGMRGLMADPQGEIIDLPIKTNFREGLTVTEYIISSYGARKGLVDTALRTADSGYLTRRLVDVSQDVIVREFDCGTQRWIKLGSMYESDALGGDTGRMLIPLKDRLMGRVLAEDVVDPNTNEIIAKRNQSIDSSLAVRIGRSVDEVSVRSPLTCEAARSVCQRCYGWSLAHGKMVDLGEAIGIIAAQSIGEPGTQLTMRTFHTGGVFTGEVAQQIKAQNRGIVEFADGVRTKRVRTSHGDELQRVEVAGNLVLREEGRSSVYPLKAGHMLLVAQGEEVEEGQLLCEMPILKQGSTEKAAKDVATDLAGEVITADLMPESKTDRQGNSTRIAQRGGMLWVLAGEVYNLPPGAQSVVKNGDRLSRGEILAVQKLCTGSGGVVRFCTSREIEIITASLTLASSVRCSQGMLSGTPDVGHKSKQVVESSVPHSAGGHSQYTFSTSGGDNYLLLTTPGAKVFHGDVIAELISDRYQTSTGGIIKYAGVETKKVRRNSTKEVFYEVTKGGTLLWIPEETHDINKDIGLLYVRQGEYIEAGTEVFRDIYSTSAGYIQVVQKNDILRSITIKPGELYPISEDQVKSKFSQLSGKLLQPGTELPDGSILTEIKYGELIETDQDCDWASQLRSVHFLLRPVIEYPVADSLAQPEQGDLIQSDDPSTLKLQSVQRLFYKDGERVTRAQGVSLLTSQLILSVDTNDRRGMKASEDLKDRDNSTPPVEVELLPLGTGEEGEPLYSLQLVMLESLVLRRDSGTGVENIHTRLLVEDGEEIEPGAVVARTEIRCKEAGLVRGIREGGRRILIVRDADQFIQEVDQPPTVGVGDLVVAGSEIAPGCSASESVLVVGVDHTQVTLRRARPYRVSAGAILHVDNEDLVQRGDNLVLLVFERSKTGDIIQGLPRIEELLEARKPKEACVLNRRPGVCQVEETTDESKLIKVISPDGTISEYPLSQWKNAMVSDGQPVEVGDRLTDGQANPHEILETFFSYYKADKGVYEASLLGIKRASEFLVNQVQLVYQSQGIDISDKHIETIVRQMTAKVRVDDGGDTTMLPGELVELRQIEQVNEAMAITGGAPVLYTPVLLGITKASLNTDSFISAASFQETTRVLTEAAIEGKSDWLRGLKENVIIGRLIPAGTGFNAHASDDSGSGSESMDSAELYDHGDDLTYVPPNPSADFALRTEESVSYEDVVLDDFSAKLYAVEDDLEDTNYSSTQ
ncbi:MAG: DNA-directed RNA polymerase subunit beta' [Prochloron sp. SP5CPC1]|nr:DNA-directed RNA polymerase subunit beta' [Candidatus Paraprochloron terpiosi SP5CPC1]